MPHPIGSNTAPEMVEWSAESATDAVDLLLEVVETLLATTRVPEPSHALRRPLGACSHTGEEDRQSINARLSGVARGKPRLHRLPTLGLQRGDGSAGADFVWCREHLRIEFVEDLPCRPNATAVGSAPGLVAL